MSFDHRDLITLMHESERGEKYKVCAWPCVAVRAALRRQPAARATRTSIEPSVRRTSARHVTETAPGLLALALRALPFKELSAALTYRREGTRIMMGRAFSLNATKLLPYLYELFRKQVKVSRQPAPHICWCVAR